MAIKTASDYIMMMRRQDHAKNMMADSAASSLRHESIRKVEQDYFQTGFANDTKKPTIPWASEVISKMKTNGRQKKASPLLEEWMSKQRNLK